MAAAATATKQKVDIAIHRLLSDTFLIYAEKCKRSFAFFVRHFWDCVSGDELVWNWHLEYIAGQLQKLAYNVSIKKPAEYDLIINIPPGTTKSTLCTIMLPVWCWVNWHWMKFITCSYSGALALEHAETSRELVRSDKFKELFPEITIKKDKDTKSNFRIVKELEDGTTILGGTRYSTSVGGTLTGFHGHILIVDDPLDPNRAASETELISANRWLDQTLSTRKIDKATTPTILIMQRLHQNDCTGHLLSKKDKKIFHVCIPGEIINYRDKVRPVELISQYQDGLLDPVRMPFEVLKDMEINLGQYGYAGQVGQNPVPPGGGMFKVEHFQIIDRMPASVNFVDTVRYWDKAATPGGGAFTVGVKMHKLKNGKFLVSDVKRGQWATDEREQIIKETAEADGKAVTIYQEQEPGSSGKDSVAATARNLAGWVVIADRPTGDKVYRADPYSVQVNYGNILLLYGEWNETFIEEHRFFPHGMYKDQVDAAAGAFNKLAGKRKAGPLLR